METWEKVTTRSWVSIYRTNDPMETIGLKLDQHDRHTHIWKNQTLCPVTVLIDSQVSDRCLWATCLFYLFIFFCKNNYQRHILKILYAVSNGKFHVLSEDVHFFTRLIYILCRLHFY